MEVMAGYKQTEVGVIPKDWDVVPMGHAFEIRNNLRLPISQTVREKMEGQYPYYGPTGIQGYINEYRVEGEHALIGEDGDHFLKWRDQSMTLLVSGRFNVNNHAHLIGGTKNLTSWFYYYFSHRNLTPYLTRQGAGRYKLTKKVLLGIPCAIPPTKAEQEAIAEALSDADALIESLEQLIAKKRHLKQGAMQELLTGKKRLPGFEIKPGYKQTEVGVLPEDWVRRPLGDVVTFLDGRRRPVKDADRAKMQGVIPYYGASGIVDYVNDYLFDEELILLGEDGENIISRNCRLVFRISGKAWVNNHAHVLKPNHNISIGYLTEYLESLNYERFNSGTAQPKLNKQTCAGIIVVLPPTKAEQEAIATILSDMDAEIDALDAKLAKARHIKEGMMHNLLTGRIRLV